MPIEPVRALRCFVLYGVEQRAIVGGPGGTRDALEALGESGPGTQIFDLQHVLAETRSIGRIGEQVVLLADLEEAQSKKRRAFPNQIQAQHQSFSPAPPRRPP